MTTQEICFVLFAIGNICFCLAWLSARADCTVAKDNAADWRASYDRRFEQFWGRANRCYEAEDIANLAMAEGLKAVRKAKRAVKKK